MYGTWKMGFSTFFSLLFSSLFILLDQLFMCSFLFFFFPIKIMLYNLCTNTLEMWNMQFHFFFSCYNIYVLAVPAATTRRVNPQSNHIFTSTLLFYVFLRRPLYFFFFSFLIFILNKQFSFTLTRNFILYINVAVLILNCLCKC